jgi:hypothetical protein
VFAPAAYAPFGHAGRRLIAHELAHVVQNGRGGATAVRRDTRDAGPEDAGPPDGRAAAPAPAAPEKVCGPNVGAEMGRAWSAALMKFEALSTTDKANNCRMLVQPLIKDLTDSGLTLNASAFDTWGLYEVTAGWTHVPPWHGPCATPGIDAAHRDAEDPDLCSNTVQIGSDCWLSGTPNYGTFGVVMRACWDFTTLPGLLPGLGVLHDLFSLESTMTLVALYKLARGDSIVGPEKWAMVTWLGGPEATATGGNRPACSLSCPGPPPPPFFVVWEPNMPRPSYGPPYYFPPTILQPD